MSLEASDTKRGEILSPSEVSVYKLFRESFRHSQGNQELQSYIFEYLSKKGFLKDLPISYNPPAYLVERFRPPMNHIKISEDDLRDETQNIWRMLYKYAFVYKEQSHAFRGNNAVSELVAQLTTETITFDLERQEEKRERERVAQTIVHLDCYDSYADPHASHLRRYAILKRPAGHAGFDEMYRDIAGYVDTHPETLKVLIPAWSQNHPSVDFLTNTTIE